MENRHKFTPNAIPNTVPNAAPNAVPSADPNPVEILFEFPPFYINSIFNNMTK